ncbi:hybrid sensor histidine kinase/response regulator [Dictyobacter aurantiacus]|uniref:histidine kinase n=1 Tax=Dictyobacter aurantiacus TaxID=1936993 RepID=A0A401ZIB1_9CHLR|nr:hybrid sensor histidine kinase/response regulator [Dictyobacter aurantiacus]GCE06580.1 hybrid sensor histidine kinase/response regulator [Dictyobacter aurantiacus]
MTEAYILLVDDDIALLQALPQALYLRMPGSKVDTADTAVKALELLKANDYDAIVSDIKMPGMDGLVLLARIQGIRPETPTLLITGHGDHNLAIQALRGGAYDFIQKPIDREYFVAALRRATQSRYLRRQVYAQQQALEQHAKSLEMTVLERTRELIEANAVKDEFISIASHELKTPLASLKGMAQLLHRRLIRASSPEVASLVSMENSIRRIEVLVNDLLNISSLETGLFDLHCQRCCVVELTQRLVDEYVSGVNPHPVISTHFPDKDFEAEIDVERLGQVVINLLSNARKYSVTGSPIDVIVTRQEQTYTISVSDTGSGIPQEMLPFIFERFYRVPGVEVQTGSSVGFGLGLYVSRQIVERHGGRIEVESTPGKGSVFSLVLPLPAAPTSSDASVEDASVRPS